MFYLQNFHIILIVVAFILGLTLPAAWKKIVWRYPAFFLGAILAWILLFVLAYVTSEGYNSILVVIALGLSFPIIIPCLVFLLVFLLVYYLKVVYLHLKSQDDEVANNSTKF